MTQEEVNDKFRKENHCEQYLVNGCSEFNQDKDDHAAWRG